MLDVLTSNRSTILASGVLEMPSVAAGTTAEVDLPYTVSRIKSSREVQLTVVFVTRYSTAWANAGHEVAWVQHQISSVDPVIGSSLTRSASTLDAETSGTKISIKGHDFLFSVDKARGFITEWKAGGVSLLTADPVTRAAIIPSFWRPPTDNDNPISLPYWKRFGVDTMTSQMRSFKLKQTVDGVEIATELFLTPPVLAWSYIATITYTITATGTLSITVKLKPTGSMPKHVPRVGLDLRLPRHEENDTIVKWHGLGPGESYPDKRSAQRVGVWSVDTVDDLQTPYEVPQENGNRMGTRWVKIADSQSNRGLRAIAGDQNEWSKNCGRQFSFVATRHSAKMIEKAKHPCDLVEEDATLLRLDAKVAGLGTAACGPGVREDHLVKVEEMSFSFVLEAVGS